MEKTLTTTTRSGFIRQLIVGFVTSLSVLSAGAAYTWIEPLMERLKKPGDHLHLTESQINWVASVIEIGPLFTPIPAGFLANSIGRKNLLLLSAPLYFLSWTLVLTTQSYGVLLLVRILQGMGIGIIMTTTPLYLSEVMEPRIRGSVGTFQQCMWYMGVIYVYVIGPFVSYQTITWLCLAAPLVFVGLFIWFPESPYCLTLQGKERAAERSLQWFRGPGADTNMELLHIKASVEEERTTKSQWRELLLTRTGRRGLAIAIIVGLTTYMSGLRTVQAYASDTFSKTTGDHLASDLVTIAMGVLTLISTAISSIAVDRFGRRPVLLLSAVGSFIVLVLAALFFFFEFHTHIDVSYFRYTPYITITLYSVLMSFSSAIGFTLQAELFTTATRGLASGTTTLSTTLMCFASLRLYHVFNDWLGLYFNYVIFSIFAGGGAVIIYFIMPETKGKTFAEIQEMLTR